MTQTHHDERQPRVVRYLEEQAVGVRSESLSRYAVGCILHGTKYLYCGDRRHRLQRGDLFFLGIGLHYSEELPEADHPFEQVVFYYTPEELQEILLHLNITYRLKISNSHSCLTCRSQSEVTMPARPAIRSLFFGVGALLHSDTLGDSAAENLKMTELIYHIVAHEDCCLKSKVLGSIDTAKESFELTIHNHIFSDKAIEELARMTHRSLTSFKKEFRRIYNMPPHKWFIRQRLIHARLLLISTAKSISEIGVVCSFPNTSHFIKLFKKAYGLTPASYRTASPEQQICLPATAMNERSATAGVY